jgi:hypothetical protein
MIKNFNNKRKKYDLDKPKIMIDGQLDPLTNVNDSM